ncbi:MAG: hypothetical protein HY525_09335 [Betaproteobacteria bacterium]|nr:hypothetical protein [Betaproteobacteria bacterium]
MGHAEMEGWLNARAADLMGRAATPRDAGHAATISFARKVFIPLTRLCRDACHYY